MLDSDQPPGVGAEPSRTYRRDSIFNALSATSFSVALGIVGVSIPLLALHVGFDATQIGLLIALSAVSQLIARSFMGAMMRKLPDKVFMLAAGFLIALSCGLVAASTTILAFILSQLAQGVARAFFFTGSQTHAVRVSDSAVRAVTSVNLAAGIGAFAGPALAGLLFEYSAQVPLVVGAAIGVLTMIPAGLLVRLAPFKPVAHLRAERILRRPGVDAACWMGAISGVWKGLLDSYVPVALTLAGQLGSTVGILVAVGNGALFLGSGLARYVHRTGIRGSLILGVAATGLGTAALGPLAGLAVAAACALAVSGLGAGALQTVGPAIATEAVHPDEQGDAITSVGLSRAAALFVAPMGMAGMVLVFPVGVAFVVAGALVTLPGALWRPQRPR